MRLIGMLDSPYVRRVAVSMNLMGIGFEHTQLSVFRHYDDVAAINPLVKVPTLITDDGVVLTDSTLILDYLERLVPASHSLTPAALADFTAAQRLIGIALVACEKTVQIVYERTLRPPEKQHEPWVDRVTGQLRAAFDLLEASVADGEGWQFGDRPMQADVMMAIAWRFTRSAQPDAMGADSYPKLEALTRRVEALPAFIATAAR